MKNAIAAAIAMPATAAATPMPACAPVLSPLGAAVVVAVGGLVGAEEEELDCGPLGTAENCSGGAAWKVSDVGVPVQPSSPQQCHSCEV